MFPFHSLYLAHIPILTTYKAILYLALLPTMFKISFNSWFWTWISSFLSAGPRKENIQTQTTQPQGSRTGVSSPYSPDFTSTLSKPRSNTRADPLCNDCTFWVASTVAFGLLALAVYFYFTKVESSRHWIDYHQRAVRDQLSRPDTPAQPAGPGPGRSKGRPRKTASLSTQSSDDDHQGGGGFGDADDERTSSHASSTMLSPTPSFPRTPPALNLPELDDMTDPTTLVGSQTAQTPKTPPSPLAGRKGVKLAGSSSGGPSSGGTSSGGRRTRGAIVQHPEHDWVRQDECGRIHGTPEDHGILCHLSNDEREKLVEQREQEWQERSGQRAARIRR
jgi:hypothetical protein